MRGDCTAFTVSKKRTTTVTFRLFTHNVSTEKMRKDKRDRNDMRGTKYTRYNTETSRLFTYIVSIEN